MNSVAHSNKGDQPIQGSSQHCPRKHNRHVFMSNRILVKLRAKVRNESGDPIRKRLSGLCFINEISENRRVVQMGQMIILAVCWASVFNSKSLTSTNVIRCGACCVSAPSP
ncbi:unnamed protein product [Discosporangium mesarthrocarpum]